MLVSFNYSVCSRGIIHWKTIPWTLSTWCARLTINCVFFYTNNPWHASQWMVHGKFRLIIWRNICPIKEDTASPTPHPETWQPPTTIVMEIMHEPTTDRVPEPGSREALPPRESDQVCVPATSTIPVGLLVEFEGMEWNPAHTTGVEEMLSPISVEIHGMDEFKENAALCVPIPSGPAQPQFPYISVGSIQFRVSRVPIQPPSTKTKSASALLSLVPSSSPTSPSTPLCWIDAHLNLQ
ncbi:hypothetical protein PO909_023395 [Leuciscus waleckii]